VAAGQQAGLLPPLAGGGLAPAAGAAGPFGPPGHALSDPVRIGHATTLRKPFHVHADSFRLLEREDAPWLLALDFCVDAAAPTAVAVTAVAVDVESGPSLAARLCPKYPRAPAGAVLAGARARFLPAALALAGGAGGAGGAGALLDVRVYSLDELTHAPAGPGGGGGGGGGAGAAAAAAAAAGDERLAYVGAVIPDAHRLPVPPRVYPLVVTLSPADGGGGGPEEAIFLTLRVRGAGEEGAEAGGAPPPPPGWRPCAAFAPRVLRTAVQVGGAVYEIRSIFGMAPGGGGGSGGGGGGAGGAPDLPAAAGPDGGASTAVCVVCISEPSTHAAFPCGHVCLCADCAAALSVQTNRCPVCRGPIVELLAITGGGGAAR